MVSKRSLALAAICYAGYHNNYKEFVRLYVENRISYSVASAEFIRGKHAKENGVSCTCPQCKEKEKQNG
jgi:hypothetical protein